MGLPRLEGTASMLAFHQGQNLPDCFMGLPRLEGTASGCFYSSVDGCIRCVSWHCPGLRGLQGHDPVHAPCGKYRFMALPRLEGTARLMLSYIAIISEPRSFMALPRLEGTASMI